MARLWQRRQSMRGEGISRRRLLRGTVGLIAGEMAYRLSEPTLVHWHGLTPPSAQDGVPGLSQDPIAAGASYDYDFPLKTPGTYWMHSHFSLAQSQKLLSAPLIIRTPEELKRDEQEVVV